MNCLLLVGTVLLLAASCEAAAAKKSCKLQFDEKALDLVQADKLNMFKVADIAKVTSWLGDFAVKNRHYTMPMYGEAIVNFCITNFTRFVPVLKVSTVLPMYTKCEKCLKDKGTNFMTVFKSFSPAMYTALRPAFQEVQKEMNAMLDAGKPVAEVQEQLFCRALTFANAKTLKSFVKPAKCNIRCQDFDCAKEPLNKLSKFSLYDDPSFKCGTCLSG